MKTIMTKRLIDSPHFLPDSNLLRFDASIPVFEVFRRLSGTHGGAFIYEDGNKQLFVRAGELAAELFGKGDLSTIRKQAGLSLREIVQSVQFKRALVPVEHSPIDLDGDPEPLQRQDEDKVFFVEEGHELVGWFLNHENVLGPATKRPVYICENDHKNNDPDHGTCYYCSGRIVRVKH